MYHYVISNYLYFAINYARPLCGCSCKSVKSKGNCFYIVFINQHSPGALTVSVCELFLKYFLLRWFISKYCKHTILFQITWHKKPYKPVCMWVSCVCYIFLHPCCLYALDLCCSGVVCCVSRLNPGFLFIHKLLKRQQYLFLKISCFQNALGRSS